MQDGIVEVGKDTLNETVTLYSSSPYIVRVNFKRNSTLVEHQRRHYCRRPESISDQRRKFGVLFLHPLFYSGWTSPVHYI